MIRYPPKLYSNNEFSSSDLVLDDFSEDNDSKTVVVWAASLF